MRGQLLIIAGGATIAVGALAFAATAAYAAPIRTSSSAVGHAPALVVPMNYHPTDSGHHVVKPSGNGLITVAPGSAVNIAAGATESRSTPTPRPTSGSSDDPGSVTTVAVPPVGSTPAPTAGQGSTGDGSASNSGNDDNNNSKGTDSSGSGSTDKGSKGKGSKDDGSSKGSNNGNDLGNKGTGANKGKGKGK